MKIQLRPAAHREPCCQNSSGASPSAGRWKYLPLLSSQSSWTSRRNLSYILLLHNPPGFQCPPTTAISVISQEARWILPTFTEMESCFGPFFYCIWSGWCWVWSSSTTDTTIFGVVYSQTFSPTHSFNRTLQMNQFRVFALGAVRVLIICLTRIGSFSFLHFPISSHSPFPNSLFTSTIPGKQHDVTISVIYFWKERVLKVLGKKMHSWILELRFGYKCMAKNNNSYTTMKHRLYNMKYTKEE